MDKIETCPQCAGTLLNGFTRLVQDACGHKKCRLCLLNDEQFCKQCTLENRPANGRIDCHTAVITYQKKLDKNTVDINCKPKVNSQIKQEFLDEVPEESDELIEDDKEVSGISTRKRANPTKVSVVTSLHINFNSTDQLYTCNFCNKSFAAKSQVRYHKYCNGERPFLCDICNQGFIAKSHYTTHLLTHQKLKPYKCTAAGCGKTFSERSKLNRHRSTHGTNRPFICQACGKAFKIKENLRTHALIHKQEKPYACTECGLKFSHSSNLKKHSAVHTNEKAHMCDQCGKRYKLKWALTLHRRVHSKTRPNKCSTCHKTFVHLKDLARHELIHAESKGFRCGICGSTFRRKDNLNRHARNTHPGKKPQIIKCVDTPNAIKVITAPPPTPKADIAEPIADQSTNALPLPVVVTPMLPEPNHVPVKLAFKALAIRNHCSSNNEPAAPKAEHVSIYEKILKPRSETLRTSTAPSITPEPAREPERIFEQRILTPFNAPSHYETSFDNKKHAVIKNIKFKLPDKYIRLNMMRGKSVTTTDGDISPTVIVNSTDSQQQQQQETIER